MDKAHKKIFSLTAVYAVGNLVEKGQSVILLPVYSSFLEAADFGVLALLGVLVALVTKVVIAPVTHSLSRFYYRPDWRPRSGVLVFNLFWFLALQSLLVVGLYWALSSWLATHFLGDPGLSNLVEMYGFVVVLTPLSAFLTWFVKLREMSRFYIAASMTATFSAVGIILYFLIVREAGVVSIIYGEIWRQVVVSVPCLVVWLRASTFKISVAILREPLKFGYPLVGSAYSNLLIQSGDRYLLQILSSINAVGLYAVGYKVASLINFALVVPLKQAFTPILHQYEHDPEAQRKLIGELARGYYFGALFLCLGVSLFARETVMLLLRNEELWAGWVIVPIIGFSFVQHGLGNLLGWGIIMRDKSFLISVNIAIAAVVNIGLNLLFIPRWGMLGAAYATLASYFVWNGLKIYFSYTLFDLRFDLRALGLLTLGGVSLYVLGDVVLSSPSLLVNVATKVVVLLSYPVVFWYSGFFSLSEKRQMRFLVTSAWKRGLGREPATSPTEDTSLGL